MTPAARAWVRSSLSRYWPCGEDAPTSLPIPAADHPLSEPLPPRLVWVALPEWAAGLGEAGRLPVPTWALTSGIGDEWQRCDWWAVAFWFLHGSAERTFEAAHGPIHSYSLRLKGWDPRLWHRAWVNRIALFLRRWAARHQNREETELFGPLPRAEIELTHDVDAVRKTLPIRLKQSAFHGFNSLRALVRAKPRRSLTHAREALRFLLSSDDYWCFKRLRTIEENAGVRSCFNLYAGGGPHTPKEWLLDPAYDVSTPRLAAELKGLLAGGWRIGLHQAFDSWRAPGAMAAERRRLERAIGTPVRACRQHWLRFSWQHTWSAQTTAGLELDTTLGFNDRSGFRNGAALRFRVWDEENDCPRRLEALPLLLMDSHLHDYGWRDWEQPDHAIAHWLGELEFVGGQASVVWHQRVFSDDYRWIDGYCLLLDVVRTRKLECPVAE